MMNSDFETEMLIQRCVDGELSTDETHRLLRRLDGITDGWKTLACGLLEDRNLSKRLRNPAPTAFSTPRSASIEHSPSAAVSAVESDSQTLLASFESTGRSSSAEHALTSESVQPVRRRSRMSHPLISLTLCAAIAFVGGLLIPDLKSPFRSSGGNGAVANSAGAPPGRRSDPVARLGEYRVEMQPGERRIEVPLVSDIQQLDRDHPLFSDPSDGQQDVRWILVPVEGNRSMLIPVSSDSAGDMQ